MLPRILLGVGAIFVCVVVFFPEKPSLQNKCAQMIELIVEELRDLPIIECADVARQQTTVIVQFSVPAARMRDVEQRLIAEYDMAPLRFVCCGYETHAVTVRVPDDHPLMIDKPAGVYRDISLSFYADSFVEGSGDIHGVGTIDGIMTLRLMDV